MKLKGVKDTRKACGDFKNKQKSLWSTHFFISNLIVKPPDLNLGQKLSNLSATVKPWISSQHFLYFSLPKETGIVPENGCQKNGF